MFRTLTGKTIVVELKNDLRIKGTLHSVDQFLNFKLDDATCENVDEFPQMATIKGAFIRGSTVRYVHIEPADVDVDLLEDAARKEASGEAEK